MTKTRWLETERLRLRPYEMGDLDQIAALLADPRVTAYTKLGRQDREQAQAILDGYLRDWRERGVGLWAIFAKADQSYIGESGLFFLSSGEAALRYALRAEHWGQGFASEAVRATISECFAVTNLSRIVSIVQQRNGASLRLMQKLGFVPIREGRDGEIALIIHAVERGDWLTRLRGDATDADRGRSA